MTWAQRLKRAFNIDIETCRECGSIAKVIAYIEDPVVIKIILVSPQGTEVTLMAFNPLPESREPPRTTLFD